MIYYGNAVVFTLAACTCLRFTKVNTVASEGDKSRGGSKGDAPGRVREGGTPPAQLGGMGERCELPHRGLGLRPRSQRFLRMKNSKNYTKTRRPRKRPRPLLYVYTKPPTKKNGSCLNEHIVVMINASALSVSTFLERNFALTRF